MKSEGIKKDILIFLFFGILCGIFAIMYIQKPYYDWFNYHYYNSWAYFNNRYDMDFMAANYRSYFIPYPDLLQYIILNKLNHHPHLFLFINSLTNALILTLVYKIGNYIFRNKLKEKKYLIAYNILFIISSPVFILLSNFTMNDAFVAIFILFGIYFLLKNLFEKEKPNRLRNIFFSGSIFGIALALKLTSSIYIMTIFLIMLIMFRKIENPIKTICLYVFGCLSSFIMISGHWYWNIYKHFGNPFLPYFNNIFHSQYANISAFINDDFAHVKARNLLEFIFFPFLVSTNNVHFGNYENSFDSRYSITIIFALILTVILLKNRWKNKIFCNLISKNILYFLILLLFISYYLNCFIFGTYRYIFATFVLFGYIIIPCIYALTFHLKDKKQSIIIYLLLILLTTVLTTSFGNIKPKKINHNKLHKILEVQDIKIEDHSYVFIFDTSISFAIPFQNPNAHYRIITLAENTDFNRLEEYKKDFLYFLSNNIYSNYLYESTKKIMDSDEKIYFMTQYNPGTIKVYEDGLKHYSNEQRKVENCKTISVHIYSKKIDGIRICEYNKINLTNGIN